MCSYIWYQIRCVCGFQCLSRFGVCSIYARVCVCVCVCSSKYACVGGGCICTGREPVNKSVWGLWVWGWNMVPGMWSNVKNSATPGNNKSPDVPSPQNKYTPLYKSSIWTMSCNKDAPNTSLTHTHAHTYTQHSSHTAAMFIYTFIYLFVCFFELNGNCLCGIENVFIVFCEWKVFLPSPYL